MLLITDNGHRSLITVTGNGILRLRLRMTRHVANH